MTTITPRTGGGNVGDNLITLTNGNAITVNATDSTIGRLNSADKFTIGTDSY